LDLPAVPEVPELPEEFAAGGVEQAACELRNSLEKSTARITELERALEEKNYAAASEFEAVGEDFEVRSRAESEMRGGDVTALRTSLAKASEIASVKQQLEDALTAKLAKHEAGLVQHQEGLACLQGEKQELETELLRLSVALQNAGAMVASLEADLESATNRAEAAEATAEGLQHESTAMQCDVEEKLTLSRVEKEELESSIVVLHEQHHRRGIELERLEAVVRMESSFRQRRKTNKVTRPDANPMEGEGSPRRRAVSELSPAKVSILLHASSPLSPLPEQTDVVPLEGEGLEEELTELEETLAQQAKWIEESAAREQDAVEDSRSPRHRHRTASPEVPLVRPHEPVMDLASTEVDVVVQEDGHKEVEVPDQTHLTAHLTALKAELFAPGNVPTAEHAAQLKQLQEALRESMDSAVAHAEEASVLRTQLADVTGSRAQAEETAAIQGKVSDAMGAKVKTAEAEIGCLKGELEAAKQALQNAGKLMEQSEQDLEARAQAAEQESAAALAEAAASEQRLAQVSQEERSQKEQLHELNGKLEASESVMSKFKTRITELTGSLSQERSQAQSRLAQAESTEQALQELQGELEATNATLTEAHSKLTQAEFTQQAQSEVTAQMLALQGQVATLTRGLLSLQQERDALDTKLAAATAEHDQREEAVTSELQDTSVRLQGLQGELGKAKEDLTQAGGLVEGLESRLESIQSELSASQAESTATEQALKRRLTDLELAGSASMMKEKVQHEQGLHAVRAETANLQQLLTQTHKELTGKREEAAHLQELLKQANTEQLTLTQRMVSGIEATSKQVRERELQREAETAAARAKLEARILQLNSEKQAANKRLENVIPALERALELKSGSLEASEKRLREAEEKLLEHEARSVREAQAQAEVEKDLGLLREKSRESEDRVAGLLLQLGQKEKEASGLAEKLTAAQSAATQAEARRKQSHALSRLAESHSKMLQEEEVLRPMALLSQWRTHTATLGRIQPGDSLSFAMVRGADFVCEQQSLMGGELDGEVRRNSGGDRYVYHGEESDIPSEASLGVVLVLSRWLPAHVMRGIPSHDRPDAGPTRRNLVLTLEFSTFYVVASALGSHGWGDELVVHLRDLDAHRPVILLVNLSKGAASGERGATELQAELTRLQESVQLIDVSPPGVGASGNGLCLVSKSLKNMMLPAAKKKKTASAGEEDGFNLICPSERSLKSRKVREHVKESRKLTSSWGKFKSPAPSPSLKEVASIDRF